MTWTGPTGAGRRTASLRGLGFDRYRDLGRPQHPVEDPVTLAELGDDGPLGMVGVGLLHDRLVLIGIEGLPKRLARLDAVLGERGEALIVDHRQRLGDPCG